MFSPAWEAAIRACAEEVGIELSMRVVSAALTISDAYMLSPPVAESGECRPTALEPGCLPPVPAVDASRVS